MFSTTRLEVRRLIPDDADAMLGVYGDADAMRWVGDGKPLDRAQCEHWIEVTHRNYALRGYGMSALVEYSSGEVVGFCGLVHPGDQEAAEIKYALRRSVWGRGLATEAAQAMLAYGARAFGLTRILATAAPDNAASHRVLVKAGMRAMGERLDEDGTPESLFEWTGAH